MNNNFDSFEENTASESSEPVPLSCGTEEENESALEGLKREIKTYVLRIGRMTAAQEKAYSELSPRWCIPFEKKQAELCRHFWKHKSCNY